VEARIEVQGLAQLNRSLRQVSTDAPKGLRLALNEAAELLADRTRPQIPRRTGRAAASLKAKSTRTSARVSMGGRQAPYLPWLDFGGRTGRGRSVKRPFLREGRYLYPTLAKFRPEIEAKLQAALQQVVRDAGLDVT
jgi:hypothetical protein